MLKAALLDSIDEDIDDALKLLNPFFLTNPQYRDLMQEYVTPPQGWSKNGFRSRLRVFVSLNYKDPDETQPDADTDFYSLFCKLDFKLQCRHFGTMHNSKRVRAFLLYGNQFTQTEDIKWLYNQLVNECKLNNPRPIPIDFDSHSNNNYKALYSSLCGRFGVTQEDRPELRRKIEEALKEGSLAVLVKYPGKCADIKGFYNQFHDLFNYLNGEVRTNNKNSLIFLFIENSLDRYEKQDNHFFWYDEKNRFTHSWMADQCPDPRIVDLAPIENMTSDTVLQWLSTHMAIEEIRNNFPCLNGGVAPMLEQRQNPYYVISSLYKLIKGENLNPDQWLKH